MQDYEEIVDIDAFVESYERREENLIALDDLRFGEIYLYDKENKQ